MSGKRTTIALLRNQFSKHLVERESRTKDVLQRMSLTKRSEIVTSQKVHQGATNNKTTIACVHICVFTFVRTKPKHCCEADPNAHRIPARQDDPSRHKAAVLIKRRRHGSFKLVPARNKASPRGTRLPKDGHNATLRTKSGGK